MRIIYLGLIMKNIDLMAMIEYRLFTTIHTLKLVVLLSFIIS